jgi:hypothetical protein
VKINLKMTNQYYIVGSDAARERLKAGTSIASTVLSRMETFAVRSFVLTGNEQWDEGEGSVLRDHSLKEMTEENLIC